MEFKALKWSVHDSPLQPGEPCVGQITLNRPENLNAVDPLMRLELDALCNEIARNSLVKVVILTGAGRGFCAGGDPTPKAKSSAFSKGRRASPVRTKSWRNIFSTTCATASCRAQ